MTYLLTLSVLLCATYVVLLHFLPYFLENRKAIVIPNIASLFLILVLSIAGYAISYAIPDGEWGNRFLHGYGGGFMGYLVCVLAARDARLKTKKLKFIVLAALIVTALGVGNEILEFILQNYFGRPSAVTINDTWLDLISNTIGIGIASMVMFPFMQSVSKGPSGR